MRTPHTADPQENRQPTLIVRNKERTLFHTCWAIEQDQRACLVLLGNMSLRMEDTENRLISEPVPIGFDRLEGHICKYAEKSYMYKYDLGHILLCMLMKVVVVKLVVQSV